MIIKINNDLNNYFYFTDGASVMVGKENVITAKLKREAKILLNVHYICHRLALACGDANYHISYITTVEKVLI